ncbi:MAG: dTDP-4-dehydrorhamnose reductase [Chloroflexi bacterium]|nr:dTDP-4-dehydrorhamnose reductase [Chloroflexota bacterium]
MHIVITGGQGQLARDLVKALQAEHEVAAPRRAELDITDREQVLGALERWQPEVVVNTAAFHNVDRCETEPEQAFLTNAAAPQRLAAACRERGALLVHISTDYVFGGQKREPYREDDPVDPLSVYAASKAAGEMAVHCTTDRHLIVRTTGLYGHGGMTSRHGNFVETMLRLAREGRPLQVVADQVLTPSSTRDVAALIAELIRRGARGTYHVTNGGQCSWYQFAAEVFRLSGIGVNLSPTTQAERPMPARRPAYSVLAHEGLKRLGIPEPRAWQEALADYLRAREP